MPSIVTHELFAQEALKKAPASLKNTIFHYPKEFSIGSSGPDLFFYYNAWPWLNQKDARKVSHLGSLIHHQKIEDFFSDAFAQVKLHPTPAKISYCCGLLCHWALDKGTHPYIFNQTGDTSTKKGMNDHRRFESHLDSLMLHHLRDCSSNDYPSYRLLQFDQETVDAIYSFYHSPVKKVWNYELKKEEVKKSCAHFYGIQKFLFDPYNIKSSLFLSIEKNILKNPYVFSSLIIPEKEDTLDILNLNHRTWYHPCTQEASTASFVDLFNQSLRIVNNVLLVFDYYLHNQCTLNQLLQLINNQSFETGLSQEMPMQFFNPIY